MAYQSLLTIATSSEGLRPAVDAAAQIAQKMDAHLDALAIGIDRSQLGYSYLGSGALALQVAMERAAEEAQLNEKALKVALSAQSPDLRWSLDQVAVQQIGVNEIVASRARYADLVVLPMPYSLHAAPEAEVALEAAMFEGMAPVLVVPPKGLTSGTPKRIVLAWNRSREALVAARRALPFLKAADQVIITVIDPPSFGEERSDPGGNLCQMLVRHGVNAEVAVLAKTQPRISDVLARHCMDQAADMLVMGAYGHSRFREAILGGATRNTLELATLPVFLAH